MRGCARFCATAHYGNDRALRVCSVVADMRGHAGEVRYRAYSGRPIVVAMRHRARFCATAQKKKQIKRRIPVLSNFQKPSISNFYQKKLEI